MIPLPPRSPLDLEIDRTTHYLLHAATLDLKLFWARRLTILRKQRAASSAQPTKDGA